MVSLKIYILNGGKHGTKTKTRPTQEISKQTKNQESHVQEKIPDKEESMKRDILIAIPFLFILALTPEFFTGDEAWYMSLYCKDIQICLLSAMCFRFINKSQVALKTGCLVFSLYSMVEAQFGLMYTTLDYNVYSWSYLVFAVLACAMYVFNRFKQFDFKSDPINEHNIHLCFWKPKEGLSFLSTLVGLPFGGLSIYAYGHLYGFRWGNLTYRKEKVFPGAVNRAYTVVDTGVANPFIVSSLDSLVGTPAGVPRVKCIYCIQKILCELGGKYRLSSFLELIPSIYAFKVLNGR